MDFDHQMPLHWQTIVGDDFEDAARLRGYWSKPRNVYFCDTCRKHDCQPAINAARRLSAGWGETPFRRAIAAASHGYVYTDIGISTRELVQNWIALSFEPEAMKLSRTIRPERYRKPGFITGRSRTVPAKTVTEHRHGWCFHRTYPGTTEDMHGCTRLNWKPIIVLTDGTLIQSDWIPLEELGDGNAYAYRLVVEMARFVVRARGMEWGGPEEDW